MQKHVRFIWDFGQEWDLQKLNWSQELLQETCEIDLTNKVQEDMMDIDLGYECDPFYFYFITKQIISSSEEVVFHL